MNTKTLKTLKNEVQKKLPALVRFLLLLAVDWLAQASVANCLSLFPVLNNIHFV